MLLFVNVEFILPLNAALNSRLRDGNYSEVKEKIGADDALANGFPSSGPR